MDRQEALERSQTGEKPEGGYYSASERISLRNFGLGRITRISSSRFTGNRGGAGGGRGGAIVPLSRSIGSSELVPTTQTPQVDSNLVSSLQKQINALTARDEQQLALNNNIIGTLQSQFQILQTKVVDLGNQLLGVKTALISDSNLEQKKEVEEKTLENREAEQQYRTDKENLIEKKIVSALMAPIRAIGQRVQFTLGRVMEFFTILFSGWLFDKAIETFRALSRGNTEKLENIKNSVLKNLAIAGGILLLLNGGFLAISRTIASLSLSIGSFLLKNTIGRFFGLLGNAARGAAGAGAAAAGAGAGGKPPTPGGKPGGKPAGGLGTLFGTGMEALQGNWAEAGLGAAAFLPGAPGMIAKGAFWSEQLLDIFGKGIIPENNQTTPTATTPTVQPQTPTVPVPQQTSTVPVPQQTPTVQPQTPTVPVPQQTPTVQPQTPTVPVPQQTPTVQPQTPTVPAPSPEMTKNFQMAWDNRNNGFARGRIESSWNQMSNEQQQQAKIWAQSKGYNWSEMKLNDRVPTSSPSPTISPAQTQRIPTSTPTIGQEPEAKPNVVYMSSGGGQPQMPQMSERSGAASEVPSISSGNPDNFYLLYSQVSYNIVT